MNNAEKAVLPHGYRRPKFPLGQGFYNGLSHWAELFVNEFNESEYRVRSDEFFNDIPHRDWVMGKALYAFRESDLDLIESDYTEPIVDRDTAIVLAYDLTDMPALVWLPNPVRLEIKPLCEVAVGDVYMNEGHIRINRYDFATLIKKSKPLPEGYRYARFSFGYGIYKSANTWLFKAYGGDWTIHNPDGIRGGQFHDFVPEPGQDIHNWWNYAFPIKLVDEIEEAYMLDSNAIKNTITLTPPSDSTSTTLEEFVPGEPLEQEQSLEWFASKLKISNDLNEELRNEVEYLKEHRIAIAESIARKDEIILSQQRRLDAIDNITSIEQLKHRIVELDCEKDLLLNYVKSAADYIGSLEIKTSALLRIVSTEKELVRVKGAYDRAVKDILGIKESPED